MGRPAGPKPPVPLTDEESYVARARPCGHRLLVSDYLDMRGRQYRVGEMPFAEHCTVCDGPFSRAQVEARGLWTYQLLYAIRVVYKKAIHDSEAALLASLRKHYKGQEVA